MQILVSIYVETEQNPDAELLRKYAEALERVGDTCTLDKALLNLSGEELVRDEN